MVAKLRQSIVSQIIPLCNLYSDLRDLKFTADSLDSKIRWRGVNLLNLISSRVNSQRPDFYRKSGFLPLCAVSYD